MRAAVAIAFVLVATGCTIAPVDPAGRACDDKHACAGGFACIAGACEIACAHNSDCPGGRACSAGGCAVLVNVDGGVVSGAGEGEGAAASEGEGEGAPDAGVDDNAPTLALPQQDTVTPGETPVDVALSGSDADSDDTVSFVVTAQPAHGLATSSATGVHYVPNEGFAGFDTIGVAASDGRLQSAPHDVAIDVIGRSCAHILTAGGSIGDGDYLIDLGAAPVGVDAGPAVDAGPFNATLVHCDMSTAGGGFTLALKVDGAAQSFCYDDPLWSNDALLNPTDVELDNTEAKLLPYTRLPASELLVRLQEQEPVAETGALVVPFAALTQQDVTLQEIIGDGAEKTPPVDVSEWASLLPSHATIVQPGSAGFNIVLDGQHATRIGVASNVCCGDRGGIGIGMRPNGCVGGGVDLVTAGIHESCCSDPNKQVSSPDFAYVFVRSRDFTFLPPASSCQALIDQGFVLSGTYRIDVDGAGAQPPVPQSCDLGDLHRIFSFDAATTPCAAIGLVDNASGDGCVRGGSVGSEASVFVGSPLAYSHVKLVLDASTTGAPDAFTPSASAGVTLDGVYVDGISVTTSALPNGPREHLFTVAAGGACPCDASSTAAPGFVGAAQTCSHDASDLLSSATAQSSTCTSIARQHEIEADARTPLSRGAIELRLMADQAPSEEDIVLHRLQVFVR